MVSRLIKGKRPIAYFVGIGGIGISALARWFLAKKWAVYGSDIVESSITQELAKEGVKVKIGHKKGNLPPLPRSHNEKMPGYMVIHNPAISEDHIELKEARRRGIHPISHVRVLGCLTEVYKAICIAGSHGKSTTTSLIGLMLAKSHADPTIIVGTKLKEFHNKNFRYGRSQWLVLESDEWNRSLLHYHPYVAVVTNIDTEHLDTYKDLADIKRTFLKFLSRVKKGGVLVLNRDDRNLYSLHSPILRIAKKASLRIYWYSLAQREAREIKKALRVPGQHTVSNALAAFTVATKVAGIKTSDAIRVLRAYRGAWRRMELRGYFTPNGGHHAPRARVYDDYAHHPTEIKATLKAFKEQFPKSTLVCVYQPHQAKRLKALYKEFQNAFMDADILVLVPTYEVAGRDAEHARLTSQKLAADIKRKHPRKATFYLSNPRDLKKFLGNITPWRDEGGSPVIVMMGAGDIVNYTDLLIDRRS